VGRVPASTDKQNQHGQTRCKTTHGLFEYSNQIHVSLSDAVAQQMGR
jgi:hypothetical protein